MFHTQGIILKKSSYREFDEIFTVYTRDFGKIEMIGRGIKKSESKLANHLQVFDFSDIEFVLGKKFKVLTGATVNKNLLSDSAADFFDLLDSLTPIDDPDESIWNLILRFADFSTNSNCHHNNSNCHPRETCPRLRSGNGDPDPDFNLDSRLRGNDKKENWNDKKKSGNDKELAIDNYFQFQLLSLCGFSPNIISFNAKLPSTETFLKLFAKSDEKTIADLKISQEELSDVKNAMDYFKDIAFGYLR